MVITSVVRADTDTSRLNLGATRSVSHRNEIGDHISHGYSGDVGREIFTEDPIRSEIRQNFPKGNWGKGLIGYSMTATKINKRIVWILRTYVPPINEISASYHLRETPGRP